MATFHSQGDVMTLPGEPLSHAQNEIMEIVWQKGEVAAIEVRELLADGRELARGTVRTVLQRMETAVEAARIEALIKQARDSKPAKRS
jgi:hypothetical protein